MLPPSDAASRALGVQPALSEYMDTGFRRYDSERVLGLKSAPMPARGGRFSSGCLSNAAIRTPRSEPHRPGVGGEGVVLVEPGFREDLVVGLQEQAHLHGVVAVDDEIELGAPMAADVVGHGLGVDIGKFSARRP